MQIPEKENNNSTKTHYYWLDVIRFLAAFAVMACHFRGAFFVEYSLLPQSSKNPITFSFFFITRLGFEAVLIFFVLSGMLVGGKAFIRIANGSFRVRDYIIDRCVRIMLPLIASLLLYLPISIYCDMQIPWVDWLGSLFSLQNILTGCVFETLWTLSYEVWFYIIMCGLAILLNKNIKINSIQNTIGVILLFLSMMVFTKLKITYLFIWFIGAFALYKLPQRNRWILASCFVVSFILIVCLQLSSRSSSPVVKLLSFNHIREIIVLLFGLIFSIFLQHIIQYPPKKKIADIINKVGSKLAAFSYSLYLSHVPVLHFLEKIGAPKSTNINLLSIGLYILWLSIAMGIAYGLYWISERNTSTVKRFIKSYFPQRTTNGI